MEVTQIISEIDRQISNLQTARDLLAGAETTKRSGPGRPKGSKNAAAPEPASKSRANRKPRPEGRKRNAEAMKRRGAGRKKTGAKG